MNEGDAAASNVGVVAPPPPGFAAEESAIIATCDELAVGASLAFSYTLVPLGPAAATVRIDDAHVSCDDGRVSLATGSSSLLAAEIASPEIAAERHATRLDLRVRIRNACWVAARDVRCTLELPAGWRVLRGTMRSDGAPTSPSCCRSFPHAARSWAESILRQAYQTELDPAVRSAIASALATSSQSLVT